MRHPFWILGALAIGACAGSDGPDCGGTAPVAGTWEYHAAQTNPAPGSTLVGTMDISEVDGCDFSGSLDVDETPNAGGAVEPHSGPLFGLAVSPTSISFDVQFEPGVGRTHAAEVVGDSLDGEWVEGSGVDAPRGTFWARRTAP
jgi:hypothetical protein